MTLDAEVVGGRCQEIEQSLARLDRIRADGREHFLASADAKDIACYRLLVAIEAALGLCYHVSARHLRTVAEDYAGCFGALEKGGLIPAPLSLRLQQMARFRNLLVHMYWTIDYERVFDALERDLGGAATWSRPDGGYFVWLELADDVDTRELLPRALEAGVAFVKGCDFFPRGSGGRSAARLAYSYEPPDAIAEGVRRLASLVPSAARV